MKGAHLDLRRLLAIYVPLALSWVMMAAESPICTRFVNFSPDNRVQVAALLVLFSVALFIESPVIDLLATSTTLARSKQSYHSIRRFTIWLMVWTGGLHFLVAATPLFDWVLGTLMGQPKEIAEAVRFPMLIMTLWSPAIGWRRHVQGMLIRNGVTGPIGYGTLLRVSTIFVVCLIGWLTHRVPGAQIAAYALCSSVIAEALFVHFAGKRALKNVVWQPEESEHLRTRDLIRFHAPLAFSTMVMLTATPLTSRALAQSPDNLLAMNSWQISITLAFLLRTMTFALPEVVIANWKQGREAWLLFRFCSGIGLGLSLAMLILSAMGLDTAFFVKFTGADQEVARGAHYAFLACSALPVLSALTSYVRGVLTSLRITSSRIYATVGSIVVLFAILWLGVALRWQGVTTASTALSLSQLTEFAILTGFVMRKVGRTAFY